MAGISCSVSLCDGGTPRNYGLRRGGHHDCVAARLCSSLLRRGNYATSVQTNKNKGRFFLPFTPLSRVLYRAPYEFAASYHGHRSGRRDAMVAVEDAYVPRWQGVRAEVGFCAATEWRRAHRRGLCRNTVARRRLHRTPYHCRYSRSPRIYSTPVS